jgi:hypothetical protein
VKGSNSAWPALIRSQIDVDERAPSPSCGWSAAGRVTCMLLDSRPVAYTHACEESHAFPTIFPHMGLGSLLKGTSERGLRKITMKITVVSRELVERRSCAPPRARAARIGGCR